MTSFIVSFYDYEGLDGLASILAKRGAMLAISRDRHDVYVTVRIPLLIIGDELISKDFSFMFDARDVQPIHIVDALATILLL